MSAVASSEFVPQQLTVEPDVSDDPKCEDHFQFPASRLFYGSWSLRKVSRYGKSSIKPPWSLFISRTFKLIREEGLIKNLLYAKFFKSTISLIIDLSYEFLCDPCSYRFRACSIHLPPRLN